MSTDLETGLPSTRMIQTLIRESKEVEMRLLTEDLLVGKLLWQDPHYFCLVDQYNQQILILRETVAYMKPKA